MVLDDGKATVATSVNVGAVELSDVTEGAIEQKLGTRYDQRDMVRMGKRQELRVRLINQPTYATSTAR